MGIIGRLSEIESLLDYIDNKETKESIKDLLDDITDEVYCLEENELSACDDCQRLLNRCKVILTKVYEGTKLTETDSLELMYLMRVL